jgi:hypothetical protein
MEQLRGLCERLLEFVERRKEGFALKKLVHRCVGGQDYALDPTKFWWDVKILGRIMCVPHFTSRDAKTGKKMCYRKHKLTHIWCRNCASGKNAKTCSKCAEVVRFEKPRKKLLPFHARRFYGVCLPTYEHAAVPSHFKGSDFCKFLVSQLLPLGFGGTACGTKEMQKIIADESLLVMEKINCLLACVYGELEKSVMSQVYVVQIASDPLKCTLDMDNAFGVSLGEHFVWGFASADVFKWYKLNENDVVFFGSKTEVKTMTKVLSKFVWLSGTWRYGFSLRVIGYGNVTRSALPDCTTVLI